MASIAESLNTARRHHRAGRFGEAEALYRQILAAQPDQPQVLHYLGVIAYQTGRYDLAVKQIGQAIALNPGAADYHNNIGQACRALGRLDEAVSHYRQALALKPGQAGVLSNLGSALKALGRLDEAVSRYREALALDPAHAQAHFNLGNALREQGQPDDAIAAYRQALALNPAYVEACTNLGTALKEQGDLEEAAAAYRQALVLKPDFVEAVLNLGGALKGLGRHEEAVAHFRRAVALRPTLAEAHNSLGSALKDQGRLEEAAASYRQALALKPAYVEALFNLGNLLREQGKLEEAAEAYRRVLAIAPTKDGVRILLATLLPVVADSKDHLLAARRAFERQVAALSEQPLSLADPLKEVGATNFYLAYHGLNDRDLQVGVARLYARACPALLYTAPHCAAPARAEQAGRVRIGFVSRFLYHHSVAFTARGLITELSKEKFEKYVFRVPPAKEDQVSALIKQGVEHTVVLPDDLAAARARIAKERLDILVYLDIGMDPFTYFLAFARLAPVQCVFPGHPVTTGISAVDYFFSSENTELADAEAHYSERLVRLTRRTSYYYRPGVPASTKSRKEFGLDEDRTIYLCPQALFKVHPEFDDILADILRADPNGEVVLVEGNEPHWTRLLKDRLDRSMPDVRARVRFLPRMNGDEFLRLLTIVDVVLDTTHFGGGTTSSMAFGMGSPVVTLPGGFFRSRVTYARYRQMGLMECVADSPAQYVQIAVRLGTDPAFRRKMRAGILARNHVLHEDMEVVREYERFFLGAIGDVRKRA